MPLMLFQRGSGMLVLADAAGGLPNWEAFFQQHSGGILALILTAMMLLGLLILIPRLLRSHQRTAELQHTERMKALEAGQILPQENALRNAAGRTAVIVPAISVCAAATVTCYMVVNKTDNVIALALTVWVVSGAVSLAAITAGVALMSRLAQLDEPPGEEMQPRMNTDQHG